MPVARPTSEPRKADRVARDLLTRIVAGELTVGSLLPRENELADRYQVNRSVIREAIKLLEVHRLVRPIRRRGTVITSPLASMSPDVLRAMLSPRPGEVDRHVLAGFLEIRAMLDVQMTGLAAARRTRADLAAMDQALAHLRAALETGGSAADYHRAADELSLAMARATHNPLFEMLAFWNRMVVSDLEHLFAHVRPRSEPHYLALGMLVERIRQKDADGASGLVRAFHDWATRKLIHAAQRELIVENLERLMEKKR